MENWEKQSSPEEREAAKKRINERLEQNVKNAEQKLNEAQQKANTKQQELSRAQQLLDSLKSQLEELKKQLEDCLKKCREYAIQIAEGHFQTYGELPEGPECERYKRMLESNQITEEQYSEMTSDQLKNRGISISTQGAINQAMRKCHKEREEAEPTEYIEPEHTQRYTYTTRQPTETQPRNCEQICAGRDMTTSKPDWSQQILGELNEQGYCKSGVKIQYPEYVSIGECSCYSSQRPSISISQGTLTCRNTACGDVPCGSSRKCSCGENCIMTVSCEWKGWQQSGDSFQAVAGATQT